MTDTPNRYRDALEEFNNVIEPQIYNSTIKRNLTIQTIREALAFTEKALGEPSHEMTAAAGIEPMDDRSNCVRIFKAMIQQLLKEVRS